MKQYPNDFDPEDVEGAIQELLELNKISMEWDEEAQEFIFYMSEEQKTQHDLEGDLYTS